MSAGSCQLAGFRFYRFDHRRMSEAEQGFHFGGLDQLEQNFGGANLVFTLKVKTRALAGGPPWPPLRPQGVTDTFAREIALNIFDKAVAGGDPFIRAL